MPLSSALIRHLVARIPVMAPAMAPATAAAAVAMKALCPATIRAAATEAPRVTEPSAVMSGILKIRKLTYTPSASRARMNPSVTAPIRRVMVASSSCYRFQGSDPATAACQVGFAYPFEGTGIRHQVQKGAGTGRGQKVGHRSGEWQLSAGHRTVRKYRRVNVRGYGRVRLHGPKEL